MNMKLRDLNLLDIGNTIQMVGAVYSGGGRLLVCFFPEDRGVIAPELPIPVQFVPTDPNDSESAVHVLDMDQEDWKAFLRQTDLLETEVLSNASDGTLAKAVMRKSARQIEQGTSWNVFRRDGYRCRYCANDKVPLTVDHVVLWEAGGPSIEANLVSACRKCNKVRGNTEYADWLRHPYYLKAAEKLDATVRQMNEDLVKTLDKIPRVVHIKTR